MKEIVAPGKASETHPCPANAADFLLQNGRDEAPAMATPRESHTYAELRAAAARLAGELQRMELQPGDRVGLLGQNSLFWAATYLATLKLGLVSVPFSTMLTPDDVTRNESRVRCRAVFLEARQLRKFGPAFPAELPRITEETLGSSGPSAWPATPAGFDPTGDAVLMFTSGTTAFPKAVRITHGNIRANTSSIISGLGLEQDDRILVILPWYYCFGTSLLHTHLRVGGSLVLSNTFTYPETALDLMDSACCTGFAGVPSSFQHLLRLSSFSKRPLPHLRTIQQAGGRLHDVLIRELRAAKPDARLFVMYGATEATARLSILPVDMLEAKMGSVGRGIPGVELRVLGENGRSVAPGEVGEIVACGENISPGYLDDPESTASKFPGGLLRTGDLARVDAEGYIYIVDRKDDFIKSWGYRVSSQEVESAVLELPDLVSAAVVGVPNLESGEAVTAFITVRPGSAITPEKVIAHCRARLGKHMVPESVHVIPKMPLNSSGKVVKAELRRMASL
jgi:long-chain acyl-CoA synthetase